MLDITIHEATTTSRVAAAFLAIVLTIIAGGFVFAGMGTSFLSMLLAICWLVGMFAFLSQANRSEHLYIRGGDLVLTVHGFTGETVLRHGIPPQSEARLTDRGWLLFNRAILLHDHYGGRITFGRSCRNQRRNEILRRINLYLDETAAFRPLVTICMCIHCRRGEDEGTSQDYSPPSEPIIRF